MDAGACPFSHGGEDTGVPDLAHNMSAVVAKAKANMSRCPLGHGGVGAGPFPGYVHGKHPEACRLGCKPDPSLDKYGKVDETPHEALVREALEYVELYHLEKGLSDDVKQARLEEVISEIGATGTYRHTFHELQHGARVAWRNAPKCSNRKFWEELRLLDYRYVDTADGMFQACLELLEAATLGCVTTANIAVFRPQTPGSQDGPRVWNTQLLRYTGYRSEDGTVLGEKAEAEFTSMLQEELGWAPPPPEQRTRFDVLPVVLQAHPDQEPKVFMLPPHYVTQVPITHPGHPQIAELGLQWYAVPAVSCLELSVGGIIYTAAPFTGWYAVTEVVRNLTEESRYNQCLQVAGKLGMDTRSDESMWRDQAIVTVTQAVMHSFRAAGYGMVDHHTLMRNFWGWYNKEKERRGYVPGNWKWIIPPVSPTASPCYLQLNHMTEFTLKPNYWYGPGWRSYLARLKATRKALQRTHEPNIREDVNAREALRHGAAVCVDASGALKSLQSEDKRRLVIAYATVTGTTAKYAEAVASVMSVAMPVTLLNMEDFEEDGWSEILSRSSVVVLMTSTYGPGAPPSTANNFLAWVQKALAVGGNAHEVLGGKRFAVVGFGSNSYPRFCAAADTTYSLVQSTGATPVLPVTKVDSLSHEELSVWTWATELVHVLKQHDILTAASAEQALARMPMSPNGKPKPFAPMYTFVDLSGTAGLRPTIDRFRQEAVVVDVKELIRSAAEATPTTKAKSEPMPSTKQVILDVSTLPGCRLSYLAGDEVAVWPENPHEAVEQVALGLGLTQHQLDSFFLLQRISSGASSAHGSADAASGESCSCQVDASGLASAPFPLPNTVRTILTKYVALLDPPSFEAIRTLALFAPTTQDERLMGISESYDTYQEWVTETWARWCDMWKQFPRLAGLSPAVFFQLIPLIKSRHYSISSSPSLRPGQLHLTVARLSYKLPSGELRKGLCSNYLGERRPGDRVAIKVLFTPSFRMPLDLTAPIIMVAAGAGLAPFKGFWEERLARQQAAMQRKAQQQVPGVTNLTVQHTGPGVLIFGCRYSNDDFIYCDAIQEAVSEGVLSKVLTAFSREAHGPGAKRYVQDVIMAHKEDLAPLLTHKKCHVYVCGSSNMAQEVAIAFRNVMGANEFTAFVQAGRYHEDVFGMVIPDHRAAVRAAAARGAVTFLGSANPTEVRQLLDSGGLALEAVDHSYSTLLHVAVRATNIPPINLLLDRGCPLNVLDMYGCTALQIAKLSGHEEVATLLESRGTRLTSRLVSCCYPVHTMVMEGDLKALRKAVAAGTNPAASEYHGLTPLHVACAVAGLEIIKVLLEAGAPLDAVTRRGLLPLQLAAVLQRKEAVTLLKAAGAPLIVKQLVTASDGDAGSNGTLVASWSPESSAALADVVCMTYEELAALQGSWAYLFGSAFPAESRQKIEDFVVEFFLCLFDQWPHLLVLFPFRGAQGKPVIEELRLHGAKVLCMLGNIVLFFSNLQRIVEDLVQRRMQYGLEVAHCSVMFTLLSYELEQALGSAKWKGVTESAWGKVGKLICTVAEGVYRRKRTAPSEGSKAPDQVEPKAT